jgi:hypothetical protein
MGRAHEDQGIICILDDWTGQIVNEGVEHSRAPILTGHKLPQEPSNNQVQVRRQGIALAEAILAFNPPPRDAIQQDGSLAGTKKVAHPGPEHRTSYWFYLCIPFSLLVNLK